MLGRLLQVRHGEFTRTILLFTYQFLVITSYVVTKSTRDALFLQRYSAAQLPYAEIASAISVAAVMGIYLRVNRRVGLLRLLNSTLLTFSAMSLAFWALSRSSEPLWMLPVLYVWASVSGVLLPAQAWTLANCVVTTREAKRLFGIIGSGALCGWVVGGVITRTTATHMGAESLLLMTALTLAICPVLVTAIWKERRIDPAAAVGQVEARGFNESLEVVWQSKHLRSIAMLVALSSLVTTVVAWQFRAIAKANIPDTDALAAFFGTFNIYAGGVSLIAQLLLTSRLLRRFGLGVALLVVPCVLMAGSLGVLVAGTLWAAVLLKGGDQALRYSLDRSTVELLYLPIPARQMAHAKAFIDTVVYRAGDAAGALLVLAAISRFGLTAAELSVISIVLLGGWVAAAISAKRYYVQNLRDSIYEHRADAERWSAHVEERSTSDALADALGADDPSDILYALTLLEGRETNMPPQVVGHLLDHRSPDVRKKALTLLASADDPSGLAHAERLLQDDEDIGVRTEALLYLTRLTDADPLVRLADLDRVEASSVAAATAQFLARPGPGQNIEAARLLLDVALRDHGPHGHQARLEAARIIGSLPDCFDDQLARLLNDVAPEVARLAIRAAGSIGKTAAVRLVMARLVDRELSADATEALAAFGARAVPALSEALSDEKAPAALRYAIPELLQRVATPEAERALVDNLLEPDPVLRLRTVSALNKVRQLNPDRPLERDLIETALTAEIIGHYRSYQLLGKLSVETIVSDPALRHVKDTMGRELERIFRLMKLLLPQHDLHSAYVGLQSGSAVVHANAVEFLEQALPAQLRSLLLPLIDSEVGLGERIRMAERMVGTTEETSKQALTAFAVSDDLLREVAASAQDRIGQAIGAVGLRPLIT